MVLPGEHKVVLGSESDALAARSEGWHLRDTILVLLPGGRVLTAFLFRWPLAPGMTVAENVLKHGVGALWIDGCRVACGLGDRADRVGGYKWGANAYAKDVYSLSARANSPANLAGRWPSNLVLVHGPGCHRLGERKIKGSGQDGPQYQKLGRDASTYAQDDWTRKNGRRGTVSYVLGDGTETVAAWDCQPDCPVHLLDEQGDVRSSHGRKFTGAGSSKGYQSNAFGAESRATGEEHPWHSDFGGSSRFYPQFADLAGVLDWLMRLASG